MKKNIKKISIAIVIILLILFSIQKTKQYFESKKYLHVPPTQGELTEAVYGLGKVKSNQRYEVKVAVITTIRKLFVHEGDLVQKGQKLLMLDNDVVLTSPFLGTVTLLGINEGETAVPQSVLMKIENLSDRYIELSLEQEGALRIQKNQTAKVSFEALRGAVLTGSVTAIFPRGDEFIVNVGIEDLNKNILPGMTADVSIEIGKIKGTLVPVKALRNGLLSIIRDGKVQKIKVDVGLVDGLSAEIKNGDLQSTDEVLVPKE